MNEYRITYTTDPVVTGGADRGTFTMSVTDRTEAAAKKFFNSTAKECGRKFQSIELLRTDAPATKRNELDTLEVIRQMVADLGPQSYLATAFEGCFEDAENNIENDFGDSMKARWRSAEQKIKELGAKLKQAEQGIEELIQKDDERKAALEKMEARQVLDTDLVHLTQLAEKDLSEAEQRRDTAAQDIVTYADDPTSEQFRQAVAAHRNATSSVEAKKERLARLNTIRNAG